MILGAINIILAYSCWSQKTRAFLVAIAISLIVAAAAFPYPPLYPNETPLGDLIDAAVILPALLIVFFAHRAYKQLKQEKASKSRSK
jgi:amino acid permease